MDLKELLATAKDADAADRQKATRAALPADLDLAALEKAAAEEFKRLAEPTDSGYDDERVAQLDLIADVVDAVRAEAADRQAKRVAALSDRVNKPAAPTADDDTPNGDKPEDTPDDQPAEPASPTEPNEPTEPNRPAEPEKPQSPEPATPETPAAPDTPSPESATGDGPGAETEPALAAAAGKTGTAVAKSKNTVPLAQLPNNVPNKISVEVNLTAAADIPGYPMGSILNGIEGLTAAAMARFGALNRAGKNTTAGIATIERVQPDTRLVADSPNDWDVIEYATDEKRLPGGSLTAAADWCAIPEHVYDDFCPVAVVDGLVSLPTVTARRGSLSWPQTPKFSDIYSGTGFYMPDSEMRKDEMPVPRPDPLPGSIRRDKPCYLVQCTENQSIVLDVTGICVMVPTLLERAYPELVNHTMQQIMAAHAHKMNAMTLADMDRLVAAGNRKTYSQTTEATTGSAYGPGAMATLLGILELEVEHIRYKYRLGMNATVEVVLPAFARGILRSDLAKKHGVDMLSVSNEQIDAHLRVRGVNPQYVLDWQDAFAGVPLGGPNRADPLTTDPDPDGTWMPRYDGTLWGGDALPDAWPDEVKFLMYPAGTYFKATQDIISIDGLYDSSLLARNLHLATFTEEAYKVALKGCYDPIAVTVNLCADGRDAGNLPDVALTCPSA